MLPDNWFARFDTSSDHDFYTQPRFVTHIDDAAIAAVTALYRQFLPRDGAILDLMSSWVSHLPPEIDYARVSGLGLNADELKANPRLDDFTVQSLNDEPILPYGDDEFEGACCCVSVQYLTRPIEVMREMARVCRSKAPFVITFSNRCFPSKAVAVWQSLDDAGHAQLVRKYLQEGGWRESEMIDASPAPGRSDPLWAVVGRAP